MEPLNIALIIVALITTAGSIYTTLAGKKSADVTSYTAAFDKMSATVDRQDDRLGKMRDEIDELRGRVVQLEDEATGLRSRLTVVEDYLRRTISQLRRAKIKPDVPDDVIKQLFNGFEGE